MLSSSALTIHAEPVARYLGIGHVLCNHFEVDGDGRLTGRIARPVVWGRNKATAVSSSARPMTSTCSAVTSMPTATRTWR